MPHRSLPSLVFFFCALFAVGERLEPTKTGLKLCVFDFDSVAIEDQL